MKRVFYFSNNKTSNIVSEIECRTENMMLSYLIGMVIFIISCSNTLQPRHNLHNTEIINSDFSHDCMYHTIDDQGKKGKEVYRMQQINEYCIRSSLKETNDADNGSIFSISTFDDLKKNNVTAEQLIKWSSPIDLAERYQEFLQMNHTSSMELFYNCTAPWFGSFCQYKYSFNLSFSDIVDITHRSKSSLTILSNLTCYIHMKCNRGSSLICLDWREICDGKIDCLDEGEDEKHCLELSMNKCDSDEYQCRNGMCINEDFLLDSFTSSGLDTECLDGSDEPVIRFGNHRCHKPSRFECEDTMCQISDHFTCGNGECRSWPIPSMASGCETQRDQVFNYGINWNNPDATHFPRCLKIAICTTKTFSSNDYDKYCKSLCENTEECKVQIIRDCPSAFLAPTFPVWDGHVRLGYFANETNIYMSRIAPNFVCFDKHKCPFLIPTFQVDNYTCLHIHKLNVSNYNDLYTVFLSCTSHYESGNTTHCPDSSMLRCLGTDKCIHRRRIMDGIIDCHDGFDESLSANSCSLNDKYRFNCTSEKKCLLPTLEYDSRKQCIGGEDVLDKDEIITDIKHLPFSAFCDGLTDILSSTNDTDETDCEQWLCVNQYTRCNGLWNCPKGIDEINCTSGFHCPGDHHPCIDPRNQTMGCIHLSRIDDNIVDCLGATDERGLCRLSYPTDDYKRYRCWNDTLCVQPVYRCNRCKKLNGVDEFCEQDDDDDIPDIIKYLESMFDFYLAKKLPFCPQSSSQFPAKLSAVAVGKSAQQPVVQRDKFSRNNRLEIREAWLCHQGILIFVGKNETEECLCLLTYYGDRCQYQNQRVSLTFRMRIENLVKLDVIGVIVTLVDHTGFIHSHEQVTYIPLHDCNTKFNIYLFYQNRPKDMTKNYTVRIDAYDKVNMIYITSWILPVKFPFMPVNRMSALLTISTKNDCRLLYDPKYHELSKNIDTKSCRYKLNPTETMAAIQSKCNCAPDSLCVGFAGNRSICLCPLTKMSPRCFLNSICQMNTCLNDGLCVPGDDREFYSKFSCVCPDGFSGKRCEENDTKIDISFSDVTIPQSLLVHFITASEYTIVSIDNAASTRATMFKKLAFDEDTATFYVSLPFHLIFGQIENTFYLAVLQHNYTPSAVISTQIVSSQRCSHIRELFDQQTLDYPILRRVKYYHLPCIQNLDLVCFHDNETFMCLCTKDRRANCFHFDFNMIYNCVDWNDCQNGAQCFQDHPTCPTKRMCICQECFYGTKCQFTTKQFGLSLDAILGYQIRPHLSITRQFLSVKISIAIATLMLITVLITGVLSILTFRAKSCQEVGCGRYLLVSSITSMLTIVAFNLKLWFLILSQMSIITSQSFLLFSCISIEFVLRSLLAITDWLHACVAVERVLTVLLSTRFSKTKSKQISKWVIIGVILFTMTSVLHDPIHRRLIDDEEEERTWCLVRFSSSVEIFNSFINIFHFIIPFSLQVISTIGIIIKVAKKRALIQKKSSYKIHLKEQFHHHKYLIISSSLLTVLALPRLIISFSLGCMKSARYPALFLCGYFVSFIPPLLTFFIFIPNSKIYKQELNTVVRGKWQAFRRYLNLE